MAEAISTWFFAAVIVRRSDTFLLVHETNGTWGLPGGRLVVGESFAEAARREVREEAGIDVELDGVLEIEHTPLPGGSSRMGLSFVARQVGDTLPKRVADAESLGARWFRLDELEELQLRGPRVGRLVRAAAAGVEPIPMARIAGSPEG